MALRLRNVLLLCLCLVLLPAGSAPAKKKLSKFVAPGINCPTQLGIDLSPLEQQSAMRCMHNYARRKGKMRSLGYSGALQAAADRKAADMLRCQNFSHTPCGGAIFSVLNSLGYASGCFGVAENIAWGSAELGSVRTIMRNWINSAGHRKNLLNRRFRDVGISMVEGSFGGYPDSQLWVAVFGYRC